tara:strand:- start:1275 stop:2249 length:975 start_codon:yes stop_codon:yes gene_type:complete
VINFFTLPLITLFLLVLQALFAGSEIALLSCDKAKIRSRADSGSSAAKLVMKSINKIEQYVSTSLVGENLCIVINTVLVSFFIQRNYPQYDPHLISVLILTPLIVIFGQVVPKSIFQKQSTILVLKTIYFSIFFSIIFKPLLVFIRLITDSIVKLIGTKSKLITREELIHALEVESSVEDSTESFRDKILNKIFLFDKVRVRDIMIPINRVELLPIDSTIGQAKKIIEKTGFSRLPVYQNKIKNIVGVIHSSYLIGKSDDMKIEEIIEEGLYTNERSLASKLLNEIRKSKFNLVIVGEKTSASGIVTLEDILEEIVGEIEDEHD